MDTQISDYEALTETREIKSLTSCPRLTTHLMSVMESEFFSTWRSSWRSSQSRMPSVLSDTECPQMTPQPLCGPDTFRNHQVQMWSILLPGPLPSVSNACLVMMPVTMVSYCTIDHSAIPSQNVRPSKLPTGHPSWRPKAKTPGLSKVCNFSISGKRGSILNKHPVLKFSFEPPPSSTWSGKI